METFWTGQSTSSRDMVGLCGSFHLTYSDFFVIAGMVVIWRDMVLLVLRLS